MSPNRPHCQARRNSKHYLWGASLDFTTEINTEGKVGSPVSLSKEQAIWVERTKHSVFRDYVGNCILQVHSLIAKPSPPEWSGDRFLESGEHYIDSLPIPQWSSYWYLIPLLGHKYVNVWGFGRHVGDSGSLPRGIRVPCGNGSDLIGRSGGSSHPWTGMFRDDTHSACVD